MSLMLRVATGTTVTRQIFAEYAQQIRYEVSHPYNGLRRDIVSHEQDLLDLLPMFYQVGIDVCAPACDWCSRSRDGSSIRVTLRISQNNLAD